MKFLISLLTIISFTANAAIVGPVSTATTDLIVKKTLAVGKSTAPDSSSVLDVSSVTKGLLIPRMTTTQRDAIATPATGLQIFNTTTNKPNFYNGTSWAVVGSGAGAGGINDILNPDAETDALGWGTYNDAAGTSPVDGTGGTSSTTWTRETIASGWAPIRGVGSFYLSKPASNRQGDGANYNFAIDPADEGKRLTLTFDYAPQAGTFVDGDVKLFVYDVTNSTFCDINKGQTLANHKVSTGQPWRLTFDAHSNSTSYRLILHVASVSTSTWAVAFDNFILGPQAVTTGPPQTDWVAYTPTFNGFGTVTGVQFFSRRMGDSLEVHGGFISGSSSTSATAGISLGYNGQNLNVTSDASKLSTDGTVVGSFAMSVTGAYSGYAVASNVNSQYMQFGFAGAGIAGFSYLAGNAITGASGQHFSFYWKVPIVGWSSNMVLSSDNSSSVLVRTTVSNSTGPSIGASATKIPFDTIGKDSNGTYSTTNNRYVVATPGSYSFNGNLNFGAAGALMTSQVYLYKNGSQIKYLSIGIPSGASFGVPFTFQDDAIVGDYYEIWAFNSTAATLAAGGSNWNIAKLSNGTQTIGYQYTAPQSCLITSSGSTCSFASGGTLTVPTGASYIKFRSAGAGGGGGGSNTGGSAGGNGTSGGNTTFGPTTAGGGSAGAGSSTGPSGGGTPTINAPAYGTPMYGPQGGGGKFASNTSQNDFAQGGPGPSNPCFGGGSSAAPFASGGTVGGADTGAGGGGASTFSTGGGTSNVSSGGSGGAGACVDGYLPVSSGQIISYSIGTGGSGGSAGTSGYTGGGGANGKIEATIYFSNSGDSSVPQNMVTTAAQNSGTIKVAVVSYGSSCSSSPCTINYNPGNWLSSVTRSGAGIYTANFSAFSSTTPVCSVSSNYGTSVSGISQTSFSWNGVLWGSGAAQDSANIVIICFDQK